MKNSSNEARCFPRLLEKVLMVLGIFVCPLYFTNRAVDPCCDDYYVSRVHSREKKEGEEGYYTRSMHDADTPRACYAVAVSTAARRALRSICYDYQEQLRYSDYCHIPRRAHGTEECCSMSCCANLSRAKHALLCQVYLRAEAIPVLICEGFGPAGKRLWAEFVLSLSAREFYVGCSFILEYF